MDLNDERYFENLNSLDHRISVHFYEIKNIIMYLRRYRKLPAATITEELKHVGETRRVILDASLGASDREEFTYKIQQCNDTLRFLLSRVPYSQPNRDEIAALIRTSKSLEQEQIDLDIHAQLVLLLMASKPTGPEYWDLARRLNGSINSLQTNRSNFAIRQLKSAFRTVLPARVFADHGSYPSFGRGATRTTKVQGVFLGGLPGFGKRS